MFDLYALHRLHRCLSRTAALLFFAATFAGPAFAEGASGTALNLFNGSSLLGWTPNGNWAPASGALSTSGSGTRSVLTAVPFGEFTLQFEYNVGGSPNAGLRLWATREGSGGYRIDLDNSGSPFGVGGIDGSTHSKIASTSEGWHHAAVEIAGGQINVQIDGQTVAHAGDIGAAAGYLGFEATGDGSFAVRGVRLTPKNLHVSFNGADLSGWKSVESKPAPPSGVGHTVEKTLTLGLGGASKPHGAMWNVRNGAIHGEHGPGGLESSASYGDLLLHLNASVKSDAVKKENFTGFLFRNPAGELSGGYPIGIGAFAGQVAALSNHPPFGASSLVDETVVLAGRTVAIWIGPNLVNVYTDSRPEAGNVAQGARAANGALTLVLPNDKVAVDVQRLTIGQMPASYGAVAKKAPPPPPPAPVQAAPAPPPAPSPTETALLAQQQASAKKDDDAERSKQRSASLMSQALGTNDPQQQMGLYSQVVAIDPSNAAAVQGFKDAQAKVQAQQQTEQKQVTEQTNQQQSEVTRSQQSANSLRSSESSFLSGHLSDASRALAVAERLTPENPLVRDLRTRINSASMLRSRLYMLGGGAGLLGMAGLLAYWLRRRRQSRHPVLEVTRGLDTGHRYPLDRDRISIGAVAQDAGKKNDIVVRDVEHAISRFHCEIERRDGQMYLTDLRSSNGTSIDGKMMEPNAPALLRKGAKIDLGGSVELEFSYDRRDKPKNRGA